jgi:hypothetical protein
MPQLRTICVGNILRRVLIYGGYGLGALLFATLIAVWSRGKIQEAQVAALLAAMPEDASIYAEYGAYQYYPPPRTLGRDEDGTILFALVHGSGQRVLGFCVVDNPPPYLEWLIPIFGEHCFTRITDIRVYSEQFLDQDVDLLLAFPDLRAVDLSNTAITDAGFLRLISRLKLVELDVSGTKVSADAMRRLADCKELKEIGLSDPADEEDVGDELRRALPDCLIY